MPEFAKLQYENAGKKFALFCAYREHWLGFRLGFGLGLGLGLRLGLRVFFRLYLKMSARMEHSPSLFLKKMCPNVSTSIKSILENVFEGPLRRL